MLGDIDALQSFLSQNKKIYLYGAGEVGRAVLKYAKQHNLTSHIACVIDQNYGEDLEGIPVMGAKALSENRSATVLITTKVAYHSEIIADLKSYTPDRIEVLSNRLLGDLLCGLRPLTIKNLEDYDRRRLRFIPKPCLEYMVLNILDHCNLRCKGCDHFACVADPYVVPYETIYRDLKQLSKILESSYIISIGVMGGEPLLHQDLHRILAAVRKFFPYVKIRLTSNGLLLPKQDDSFWQVCRENNVTIVLTKYPINLDYEKIKEKAAEKQVAFQFFEETGEGIVKKSFKKIIDVDGLNDPVASFSKCHVANYGNFLMEGKFYGCPFSCQSYRIFNKKFGGNLLLTEDDYLDIYHVRDKKELFDFAARPKYYCRYCSGLTRELDWERSNQKVTEWVEE